MPDEALTKGLRVQCWDSAFAAFATAFIFERRAAGFHKRLRFLSFLGIGVPVLVGGLVLAHGATSSFVGMTLPFAASLGVVQLVVSAWSLTSDWSGGLQRSSERIWVNHELAKRFSTLARTPPADPAEFQRQVDLLVVEEKVSERTDHQLDITDAEKRAGYRAASRQFQRACAVCKGTAKSLQPSSDCPVCGEPSRLWAKQRDWHTLVPPTAALPAPTKAELPAASEPAGNGTE